MRNLFYVFLLICFAACEKPAETPAADTSDAKKVLIVGGSSSHDFERWFHQEDGDVLKSAGFEVQYTENPDDILPALSEIDLLYLSNNQPLPDPALREAIFNFADAGKGLLLVHPSVWYNWADWPAYNKELVGGGSRSHGPYGPFEVTVTDTNHPLAQNVPTSFTQADELYRFEIDPDGAELNVFMVGTEPDTGTQFPVAWTVNHPTRKIVGITLGHDAIAHESEAYKTLLKNAALWLVE